MDDCYRYLSDSDVHVLDCAGAVDIPSGLVRLEFLQRKLAERRPADGVAKLLIDFRKTVWRSAADHKELSRATRQDFGIRADNPKIRAAFVHEGRTGQISESEGWFSSREEALDWLTAAPKRDQRQNPC